jgi:hypothetical protein
LKPLNGVTTKIQPAHGIDNRTPILGIEWDPNLIDLSEDELEQILWDGEPRIAIGGKGSFLPFPPNEGHAATITPYMLVPGEQKIVADHLYHAFSTAPKPGSRKKAEAPVADLSGEWDVHVEFVSGNADHSFTLRQTGNDIVGTHVGQAAIRELKGTMDGNKVLIRSSYLLHGARLDYIFEGTADSNQLHGNLSVGEYGSGRWSAKRREPKFPRGGRGHTGVVPVVESSSIDERWRGTPPAGHGPVPPTLSSQRRVQSEVEACSEAEAGDDLSTQGGGLSLAFDTRALPCR